MAGALAIAATAWFGRDLSGLTAQPVVFGLAYLGFAVAVALRFGAIPFHLWAARLADVVPETALPNLTAYAPASLALVALAWIDLSVAPIAQDLGPDRLVVIAIAVASIVLAAVAAFVQDDIEHILGYSIIGDAGVVILALAAIGPDTWGPTRTWILAFVVARSAFAAWVAGVRAGFWTGRVADLRGWALRSPLLTVAFGLVAIASVGFPGLAAFDARTAIVQGRPDRAAHHGRPGRHPGTDRLLRAPAGDRVPAAGPRPRAGRCLATGRQAARPHRRPPVAVDDLGCEPRVQHRGDRPGARDHGAGHGRRGVRWSGGRRRGTAGPGQPPPGRAAGVECPSGAERSSDLRRAAVSDRSSRDRPPNRPERPRQTPRQVPRDRRSWRHRRHRPHQPPAGPSRYRPPHRASASRARVGQSFGARTQRSMSRS